MQSRNTASIFKKMYWKKKIKAFREGSAEMFPYSSFTSNFSCCFSATLFFSLKEITRAQAEKGPPGLPNLVPRHVRDVTVDN